MGIGRGAVAAVANAAEEYLLEDKRAAYAKPGIRRGMAPRVNARIFTSPERF
jgi:hypothetical protein